MADDNDKQQKGDGKKAADDKPKRAPARKTAAKADGEKPRRTRTAARAKTGGEAKPKAPARRRAAAKPEGETPARQAAEEPAEKKKAPDPQADQPVAEKSAPARRRRAARERPAPKAPPAPPVVTARARYVRSSARKARLVLDHIRGKEIGEARAVLRHSPRGIAREIERLLDSAVANAENNHELVGDDLLVKEIYADEGPTIKRFRARAQGRAYRIRKRTSHLTVALTPKE
jgi:ribosomal protein L22